MSEKQPFAPLALDPSSDGWGPSAIPDKFKDIPYYSPYNKGAKLGKAADWQATNQKGNRGYGNKEGRDNVNTTFVWDYIDEDASFQVVDNTKTQQKRTFGAKRFQNRGIPNIRSSRNANWNQAPRQVKQLPRKHQMANRYNQYSNQTFTKWGLQGPQQRKREHSIEIKPDWTLVEEIEFSKLNKLNMDSEPEPEDLRTCGHLEPYDKAYDRVSSRTEKGLESSKRAIFNVSTSQDPIIAELGEEGQIFATDSILSHLMVCTRSIQPWDLIITRVGSKLYFDKRDQSRFDYLTVNETALEPPMDDGTLSTEATFINQNFGQQILNKAGEKLEFEEPNPFQTDPSQNVAAVGYKYRRWSLDDDLDLVARCEIDGYTDNKNFLTIRALNEFDLKTSDWRKTIDSQKGALLATELKNNSMKLAKWTAQALLSGSQSFKLGYVSRVNPRDSLNHIILGTQDYKPKEFATQISLNWKNSWAVLKYLAQLLIKKPEGRYALLRDTEKPALLLYSLPADSKPVNE